MCMKNKVLLGNEPYLQFSLQTCPSIVLDDQNSVYCVLQYTDRIKVNWMPHHSPQDSKVKAFVNMIVDQKITPDQRWEILSAKNDKTCGIMNRHNIPRLQKEMSGCEVGWREFQRKFRYSAKMLSHSLHDMRWSVHDSNSQVNKDTPSEEKRTLQQFRLPLQVL